MKLFDWVRGLFKRQAVMAPVAPAAPVDPLPYDPKLIQDYNPQNEKQRTSPYVSHFKKGNKQLYYLAAAHQIGLDSEAFQSVERAFEYFKPQAVIVEGLETSKGWSPSTYQDQVLQYAAKNFEGAYEPYYVAHQAMQAGIPFIGGEPPDQEIFKQMGERGYSAKDVMAFYLLRSIPHEIQKGKLNAGNFDTYVQHYLSDDSLRFIPRGELLTADEFKQWYATHNDVPERSYLDIQTGHMAPIRSPDATYFQRMGYETGMIRERHLDGVIKDVCGQHDRTLTVYGMAHLMHSRKVFEHMFSGPSQNMQLV